MSRPVEAIRAEIRKLEGELRVLQSRVSRETCEQNVVRHLAELRGAIAAVLPSPEAVAGGSAGLASREAAVLTAAYVALCSPGASDVLGERCRVQVRAAQPAKDRAKAISGVEGRLERLRREEREAEIEALRADLERRSQRFEAEQNAARSAA